MWIVIKLNKNKLNFFKQDFKKKFKNECVVYYPTVLGQKFYKNKIIKKKLNLLGDYIFCFHESFSDIKNLNQIKFLKGVNFLLDGYLNTQEEIKRFIDECKSLENKDGHITQAIYKIEVDKLYKFNSGPFAEKIFRIIQLQKNKIDILMGDLKTSIGKKNFLFSPI